MGDKGNNTDDFIVCYAPTMITTNGIWQGDNPLDYSLPLFILQLTLVVAATRIFVFLLKPFRQPRVIAEILVSYFILLKHVKKVNAIFMLRVAQWMLIDVIFGCRVE